MSISIDFRARIYSALNITAITQLLDDYDGNAALFIGNMIPQDCIGYKTINVYQTGVINGGEVAPSGVFSADCRAKTEGEAFTIAQAVFTAINRISYGSYYIVSNILPALKPADDTDAFNVPVEITIKQR